MAFLLHRFQAVKPSALRCVPSALAPFSSRSCALHNASSAHPDIEKVPPSFDDEDPTPAFESHHPSVDRSAALALSPLRSHYPSSVWRAVTRLFPERQDEKPVCVDVSVGTPEGRAGVELARRGFHVIGVEADSGALARTFRYAQAQAEVDRAPTSMEFITAKVEPQMLPDGRADLTSFFHCRSLDGLHLMDTPTAISEAWRLLKPGAYLVAAWNDRDLRHPAIQELEAVLEHRVKGYSRHQKQRCVESWNDTLQAGGMFRLKEYSVHTNPVPLSSHSALIDALDNMSFVRARLRGEARKRMHQDVFGILERHFGHGAFYLPLETKLYVMEKLHNNHGRKHDKDHRDHQDQMRSQHTIFG